jgi:hypothetical protein
MQRVLVGNPEGKRHLKGLSLDWKNNIKIDKKMECEGFDWIDLAQDTDNGALANRLH